MKIGIFKNLSIGEREKNREGEKDTQRVHVKISEVNMVCDCCVWTDGGKQRRNKCLLKKNKHLLLVWSCLGEGLG